MPTVEERIRAEIDRHPVVLFMKGTVDYPMCGFSSRAVQALLAAGAPIDGFGVGTRMNTSNDCPYLECAYKLQEYAGEARRKRSEGKASWPGRKQVFRRFDADGWMAGDTLALENDDLPGVPLLECVMRGGKRTFPAPALTAIRDHARARMARIPTAWRRLETGTPYPVDVSPTLHALARQVDQRKV